MTAGCLSLPIMRPNHRWTILHVSILAMLLLTLNADSEDSNCDVVIEVRRHTAYEAAPGENLRINCPVKFCNNSPPTVSWYKHEKYYVLINGSSSSHISMEWNFLNHLEGTSFLIFKNILRSDSGAYQCRSGLSVSNTINLAVYDNAESVDDSPKNDTNSTILDSEPPENPWLYVYTAAGIVAFVIIVIISVISMQWCKGKSKKETETDNQYMAIPMVEQPFPQAGLQASPRGSPSVPPSRRSSRRKTPPSQLNELPPPRDNEHRYGEIKGDRGRQRNTAEENNSIVYAALNHQPVAGAAARPWRQKEESSEYVAIRIKANRH